MLHYGSKCTQTAACLQPLLPPKENFPQIPGLIYEYCWYVFQLFIKAPSVIEYYVQFYNGNCFFKDVVKII